MSSSKQVKKYLVPSLLIVILAISILAAYTTYHSGNLPKANPDVYIGVAFGGNTTEEAKLLIDRVKSYTNLFVLDAGRNAISENETSVEEICDYAVSQGLSVIINLGVSDPLGRNVSDDSWFWQQPLNITEQWTQRWGSKFLGLYYNDEPGGVQLNGNWTAWFSTYGEEYLNNNSTASIDLNQIYLKLFAYMDNGTDPQNYNVEADFFVQDILKDDPGLSALNAAGVTAYTSDYGLYWYDYLGGYNVLFAELGGNTSVAGQIALVKGAARLQDKEWGTMITWEYSSAPYLESGDQMYDQMLTSYEAGAKYIVIFDYPYLEGNNYGALTNDQFNALQRFWNNITQKKFPDLSGPEAVLVLPENYGWGIPNANNTIWGFWPTDNKTQQIALATNKLLTQYGVSLDIVYDDPAFPISNVGYKYVYYWNSTNIP